MEVQHPALAELETQENVKPWFVTAVQELFYMCNIENKFQRSEFFKLTTQLFFVTKESIYFKKVT